MSAGVGLIAPLSLAVVPLAVGFVAAGAVGAVADSVARRQIARLEAAARLERALIAHDALTARATWAAQGGGHVTPVPALDPALRRAGDPAAVDAAIAQIVAVTARAAEVLGAQLATARTAVLVGTLDEAAAAVAARAAAAPSRPSTPQLAPPAGPAGVISGRVTAGDQAREALRTRAETVRRVLGRLDPSVPGAAQATLDHRARQVLTALPGEASRLVDDLRYAVQEANEALAAVRARLADLHERLDRYSGDAVAQARATLHAAADDPAPDWTHLAGVVDGAVDAAVEEALRAYTALALRESLEEIGCEVEDGFESLLTHDGVAHLRRPGWSQTAVRVRAGADDGELHFNMVRPRTAQPGLDPAAERDWCDALGDLPPALGQRGVQADVDVHTPLGQGRAQRVDPARFPFAGEAGDTRRERTERRDRSLRPDRRS